VNTILILDDEYVVRQSFVDYFEDNLWRVVQAESGEQALELLETEQPEVAIVDIRLPGIDGDVFIREAIERKKELAFVICSGSPSYGVPDDLQNQVKVSKHFFRKPVTNFDELEQDVLRIIKKSS
jgi:two-component system response regulator (stage 0 sporulation protein F)